MSDQPETFEDAVRKEVGRYEYDLRLLAAWDKGEAIDTEMERPAPEHDERRAAG